MWIKCVDDIFLKIRRINGWRKTLKRRCKVSLRFPLRISSVNVAKSTGNCQIAKFPLSLPSITSILCLIWTIVSKNGPSFLIKKKKKNRSTNHASGIDYLWILLLTLKDTCISESCIELKIELNFYFHTSLWCLKRFYEGL